MTSIKIELNRYQKYKECVHSQLSILENMINDKSDIEIILSVFPDDGLCVMYYDNKQHISTGMSINAVLELIKRKGKSMREVD